MFEMVELGDNLGRFLLPIVVCLRALSQCYIETLDFLVYIRLLEALRVALYMVLHALELGIIRFMYNTSSSNYKGYIGEKNIIHTVIFTLAFYNVSL